MNIFHARFTTGQVLAASGATNAALQSWLRRGVVVGSDEDRIEGGSRPGIHRRYSFHNTMLISAGKALVDQGVSVDNAFAAAMGFAHAGDVGFPGHHPERVPGCPFSPRHEFGLTLLCVAGDAYTVYFSKLKENPIPSVSSLLRDRRHPERVVEGFVILVMNTVFERVVAALGYNLNDVLRVAYPPLAKS